MTHVSYAIDSDNDGISDSIELTFGYNPTLATETPTLLFKPHRQIDNTIKDAYSGRVVSILSDINGDNYPEFLVGGFSDDESEQGDVKVYSGLTNELIYTFKDDISGTRFGRSVADAGDINKDGYSDIIIGACLGTDGLGAAKVFSGKDGSLLKYFHGENSGDHFGEHVASAGDVNNDGYSDVLISAPSSDTNFNSSGSVYIYSGFDGQVLRRFQGTSEYSSMGRAAANIGDIDNDGIPDFVFGSPGDSTAGFYKGSAQVYSGKKGDFLYNLYGNSGNYQSHFGHKVAAAGDVNNDGTPDILVGSINDNSIIFSGKDGSIIRTHYTAGRNMEGRSVAGLGDINNDNHNDIAVTDNRETVFIFSGKTGSILHTLKNDINHFSIKSIAGYQDQFGYSYFAALSRSSSDNPGVSLHIYRTTIDLDNDSISDDLDLDDDGDQLPDTIEDELGTNDKLTDSDFDGLNDAAEINTFNLDPLKQDSNDDGIRDFDEISSLFELDSDQDGISDIFETYHGYDPIDQDETPTVTFIPEYKIAIPELDEKFAFHVSGAGDINQDGFIDVLISNRNKDLSHSKIVTSNEGLGIGVFTSYGRYPTPIGDINQDGFSDILTLNIDNRNEILFYSGKDSSLLKQLHPNQIGYIFNSFVSTAGDVNNDGFSDIIISATKILNDSEGHHQALVISGKDFSIIYSFDINEYITTVTAAGDVNNDGHSDVIITASNASSLHSYSGLVKIYSGKSGDLLYSYTGSDNHSRLGSFISAGIDINKDNHDDFAIASKGKIQIYSGKTGALFHEISHNSFTTNNVTFLEDVNRDGYQDIAIGSYKERVSSNRVGKITIYSGKDGSLLHELLAGESSLQLGRSISSIGDVNRDGYSDFIASSTIDRENGPNYGQGIVYISSVDLDLDEISDHHDLDDDGDELSDLDEIALGTNQRLKDSDFDRLEDGFEVNISKTDPLSIDTDKDRLTDYQEINIHSTSPLIQDTDGDELDDGDEIKSFYTDPLITDTDGDTLTDGHEVHILNTNPRSKDSDKDGLEDNIEISIYKTNPNNPDSDQDLISDYDEIFYYSTSPISPDSDNDNLFDGQELFDTLTNPLNADSDNDGLTDYEEFIIYHTNPSYIDSDEDGITDYDEIQLGSNPNSHLESKNNAGHLGLLSLFALFTLTFSSRRRTHRR